MTPRVKICGITRQEDADLAIELGADYLGFIFVRDSPRYIEPERVPRTEGVQRVGVFRGSTLDEIRRAAEVARVDVIQIHGEAYPVDLPLIHAFNVRDTLPDTTTHADYVLFDTGGGTGRVFDWSLLAAWPGTKPFFLAGGLSPDNIADAIERTRPYAVDVNSGVEVRPGVKDHARLRQLFERIRR